jgi:UDP-glucose 4-epimerase
MRSIAITGVSGYLGSVLARLLDGDPSISRIVGIDVAEPAFSARNLEFYSMDVRSPDLVDVLRGCDTVVHLAAVHQEDADVRDVNVGGTRNVTEAVSRAGVRKLIFASSHSVYGVHADNDFPLTESSPVRPNVENAYARSKAEAEQVVAFFASQHPEAVVTTLRFAWISGPNLPASQARAVDVKVRFVVAGYDVPMQTVHEDDAAAAVALAIDRDIPGVFNVCADEAVEAPDEILGQRRVVLPLDRARQLLDRTATVGLSPPGSQIGLLMYPSVMSNDAITGVGFAPRYTGRAALEAAAARRRFMSVGKLHVRRRDAILVGATAIVALASAMGRRRARRWRDRGSARPRSRIRR